MTLTERTRVSLWFEKLEHLRKKWSVFSTPWLQNKHKLESVSAKLWLNLWLLSGLKSNLNIKRKWIPIGSCISKILFAIGRMSEVIWSLNLPIEGIESKIPISLFHEETASGKKLLAYLDVWHRSSRNRRVSWLLYKKGVFFWGGGGGVIYCLGILVSCYL